MVPSSDIEHWSDDGFDAGKNLTPEMYLRLKKLAYKQMSTLAPQTVLQPTILVHEAWMKMAGNDFWKTSNHFLATATTTMRHILIDHLRKKERLRHGGDQQKENSEVLDSLSDSSPEHCLILINEGIIELETCDPERAAVVVERFFGGLSHTEIAKKLGMSKRTVDRHWAAAKVWLFRWMNNAFRED